MKTIVLAIVALWISAGVGRRLMAGVGGLRDALLERFVYAAALGLGIVSYGTFALGLCGLLRFWPVTLWWIVLAVVGLPGMISHGKEAFDGLKAELAAGRGGKLSNEKIFCIVAAAVVIFCGFAAILNCFVPPNGLDWDALAYHLADPKVFLQSGRISSLPAEHHSNFPLTMETLFAVGLLYDGYSLANMFHFLMGTLTVLAILAFCRRRFSPVVGWAGALIFATTPVVLWEASVSYIELGFGLYATLAAFAAISATEAFKDNAAVNTRLVTQWIALSGAMMGFALGMKYLALLPFVFIGLLLILRRIPLKQIVIYAGIALTIASPWYVKNSVITHNPVYPFAYSVFPQSRYWSADRAKLYQGEQDHFGEAHSLKQPAVAAQNLLLAPFRIVSEAGKISNPGEYTFMALIGGLYGAFSLGFVLQRRVPPAVRNLFLLAGLQLLAWFFVAQISRYLVAVLPLLAIVCGYSVWRLAFAPSASLMTKIATFAALTGQVVILLWGLFLLPTSGRIAYQTGTMQTATSMPETLAILSQSDGAENYLRRSLDVYDAIEWINANTPKNDGVVLYDNVLGFYLDRPYLWGNAQHSSYIPYETLTNGEELTKWFQQKGIRYALFNLNLARPQYDPDGSQFPEGLQGNEEVALRKWYGDSPDSAHDWQYAAGDWHLPIQDAIKRGLWRTAFAKNGVIVLGW